MLKATSKPHPSYTQATYPRLKATSEPHPHRGAWRESIRCRRLTRSVESISLSAFHARCRIGSASSCGVLQKSSKHTWTVRHTDTVPQAGDYSTQIYLYSRSIVFTVQPGPKYTIQSGISIDALYGAKRFTGHSMSKRHRAECHNTYP